MVRSGLDPIVLRLEDNLGDSIRKLEIESQRSERRDNSWVLELDHFLMKMIEEGKKIKPVYIANSDEINSIPINLRPLYKQSQICYDIFYELGELYSKIKPEIKRFGSGRENIFLEQIDHLRLQQELLFRLKDHIRDANTERSPSRCRCSPKRTCFCSQNSFFESHKKQGNMAFSPVSTGLGSMKGQIRQRNRELKKEVSSLRAELEKMDEENNFLQKENKKVFLPLFLILY